MIPEILRLNISDSFSIPIYSFGLMMLLCFLGAMKLLERCLEESGLNKSLAEPLVTYAAVCGILGARIFSVFSNVDHLIQDPFGVIFSSAGFVFYGGFIGGVIGVWCFLKKENLSFLHFSNIVAAPLAFGYAIGRLGCQLSGDGDYGLPTDLPWGMNYALGVIPTKVAVHPTPVYESVFSMCLALFLRSNYLNSKLKLNGQLFGFYLIISAIFRFFIETIRVEPKVFSSLSQAQVISIPLLIIGLYFIYLPAKNFNNK
jgi:phosphatidylglycerol:prolipoprotein diacylglycerol transferase